MTARMIETALVGLLLLLPAVRGGDSVDSADTAEAAPVPAPLPPPSPEVSAVQQQVASQRVEVAQMQREVDAIQRYLADRQKAQQGQAPRGWMQPSLDAYAAPNAPASFIPPVRAILPAPQLAPTPSAAVPAPAPPAAAPPPDASHSNASDGESACAPGCTGCSVMARQEKGPRP